MTRGTRDRHEHRERRSVGASGHYETNKSSLHLSCAGVLPINIIYEKVYVFVWCWFIALFFVDALNLLLWLMRVFAPMSRMKFVTKYLK